MTNWSPEVHLENEWPFDWSPPARALEIGPHLVAVSVVARAIADNAPRVIEATRSFVSFTRAIRDRSQT